MAYDTKIATYECHKQNVHSTWFILKNNNNNQLPTGVFKKIRNKNNTTYICVAL